jgi:hypothetical protein
MPFPEISREIQQKYGLKYPVLSTEQVLQNADPVYHEAVDNMNLGRAKQLLGLDVITSTQAIDAAYEQKISELIQEESVYRVRSMEHVQPGSGEGSEDFIIYCYYKAQALYITNIQGPLLAIARQVALREFHL